MDAYFGEKSYYDLERRDGLLHVTLQVLYKGSHTDGTKIRFVLDTGSYMTVISRSTAMRRGFDILPKHTTTLFGFGGGIDVDYVRIPALIVLGCPRTDVPVLIPHDMYRIHPKTGEKKLLPDVLGLNVLEYYNYFIDTENDRLYLKDNPNPRFYSPAFASGQVFLGESADKSR